MLYQARILWNLSVDEIWKLPDTAMSIVFDDGILETTMRATVYSYYLGEFHRQFPEMPFLMHHHLGTRQIQKGTELKILSSALWDCKDHYGDAVDMEVLSFIACEAINRIYNDFTSRLKSYVSTISILDFLDAMEHPEIEESNANIQPTMLSIDQNHATIRRVLRTEGELKGNTLARIAKSNLVDIKQLEQCLGARGYVTDIDSNIFRQPITKGYMWGMMSLYDSMVESRSASKAHTYAKDPVAESEYFNREMQLVASVLTRLHHGDCGSTEYLAFKVQSGDLRKIAGKHYLLSDGSLGTIHENDQELIGKVVQLRSVLKCRHPDSYGVCSTCFGELSNSIPARTNLGHVAVTIMCEIISQNVLSIRHIDGSSKVDDFCISDFDKRYIRAEEDVTITQKLVKEEMVSNTVIKLAERLASHTVLLIIPESQSMNLSELLYHPIEKLTPSLITELTEVIITVEEKESYRETVTVPVSMGSRHSWFTAEALHYIKEKGWTITERGKNSSIKYYSIDFSDWNVELPLFQLPLKHADMVEYMKTIKSFIMASGKSDKSRVKRPLKDFPTIDQGLLEFYKLISSKLQINIAHLEAIILTAMIRSADRMDHRLPRPISEGELGSYRKNMVMRSHGQNLAHERQDKQLTDIRSFTIKKRPDSNFDTLLMPFPYANPTE